MAIKSYEERLKEQERLNQADLDNKLKTSNANFDAQKQQTTDIYNKQINETSNSYNDLYRENAIQKLINEREVAESMANMGLTDSGLNRTQQTAIQLSYANNKNKIDINRQKAVDTITSALAQKISDLNIAQSQNETAIRDNWHNNNVAAATKLYNNDVDNYTAQQKAYYSYLEKQATATAKAQQEASQIISSDKQLFLKGYTGSLKDAGVQVRYNDDDTTSYHDTNSGKTITLPKTTNPRGGKNGGDNSILIEKYGAFSNGYQPKGVDGYGAFVKQNGAVVSVGKSSINGNKQNVFITSDGTMWQWDGIANDYVIAKDKNGNTKWDFNGDGTYNIKDLVAYKKG